MNLTQFSNSGSINGDVVEDDDIVRNIYWLIKELDNLHKSNIILSNISPDTILVRDDRFELLKSDKAIEVSPTETLKSQDVKDLLTSLSSLKKLKNIPHTKNLLFYFEAYTGEPLSKINIRDILRLNVFNRFVDMNKYIKCLKKIPFNLTITQAYELAEDLNLSKDHTELFVKYSQMIRK